MKKLTWNVDYNLNRMNWISCKRLSDSKYWNAYKKKDNKQFIYLFVSVPVRWFYKSYINKNNKEIVK